MSKKANPMPGPYKAKGHKIVTDTPVECLVARVSATPGTGFNQDEIGEMRSEEMATARLLAAAPDLLEALEAFVRAIAPSFVDCHANAVKAIAKAKGKAA